MKRLTLSIAIALALVTGPEAQVYTYLKPPTLAVMDFEVSMTVLEKVDTTFYGKLVSQALLSVLVQQNASARVEVTVEDALREFPRPKAL